LARKGVLIGLLVAVLASTAWGFEVYFSDAAGNPLGKVWEGQYVYVVINDPDKGACGIDQFLVDLIMFDLKTGAWYGGFDLWFRELGGIGSGKYFLVRDQGSNTKVGVQIGARFMNGAPGAPVGGVFPAFTGYTHWTGLINPVPLVGPGEVAVAANGWLDGAWEYVDENVLAGLGFGETGLGGGPAVTNLVGLPQERLTARVDFEGLPFTATPGFPQGATILGRFENNDTIVLIARDTTDERNYAQHQTKIIDTVATLTVTPSRIDYGCGPSCDNIIVTIDDKDENLNCNEIEYVPFFVIVNPGGWNPGTSGINNFCSLMLRGSVNAAGTTDLLEPIRWYNIYHEPVPAARLAIQPTNVNSRWIEYPVGWLDAVDPFLIGGTGGTAVGRALFFAAETSVDSGVFEFNFGNIEELQAALGFRQFPAGTTIAFYYIDPNDFDDMTLATIERGSRAHSETFITDANGISVSEVKLGAGWGGLYVRVYDADANVEACCQDHVVVHICDPHNEDDSEYYVIDEISNDSGIFFSQSGIPLLPVWDAVSGYQLVFDDWTVQSFNEDTIFVRYNSVDYLQADLNALGDGNANDIFWPPQIDINASRNQAWDVSFAKAKVYDFQVFDGTTHHMRFLNGQYQPVDTIPISGSLYLEVTDLDQNEHPALRELVFGQWNKDASSASDPTDEASQPLWFGLLNTVDPRGSFRRANVNPFLQGVSITNKNPTVKILMFNAQNGTWERMDLRETAVGSGIFRSTTCVLVSSASLPVGGLDPSDPMGHLWSKPGDTIMAFYQDPSNHSDVSIISIKVSEGGAGGITPPTVALSVAFDRANYNPGDTVTITVTDEQYAGAMEIAGAAKPLILKKADGTELASWTQIPAVSGQPGKFRVSYVLPATVTGTITAVYTDPLIATRTAQAQATVAAPVLTSVSDVKPVPEVFSTSTAFTVYAQPAGAVPNKVTIAVYDLTGRNVATLTGTNTTTVSWNGGTLRNGAYIYVWTVEGGNPVQTWTDKGFVYIKR